MTVPNGLIAGVRPPRRRSLAGATAAALDAALGAALCAVLLAGCGGTTPGTSGPAGGGEPSPARSGGAVTEQELANLEKIVSGAEDVADQSERDRP